MSEKIKVYSLPDRIWHWVHGISIFLLVITSLVVHMPDKFHFMSYRAAVKAHTVFGFIVIFDYFFWLLHMFLYGYIRHYTVNSEDIEGIKAQIRYYTYGIFKGEKNPFTPTEEKRLNPLQRISYLGLMFILLPIQIITGFLLWSPIKNSGIIDSLGGLRTIAAIHSFFAYVFIAFLIGHLYLATTGVTVFADYKAMITGWAEEE